MLGRKNIVQCGMILLAFASLDQGIGFANEPSNRIENSIYSAAQDSVVAGKKRSTKKDTKARTGMQADKTKTTTGKETPDSVTVNSENGVTITTTGSNSLDTLAPDEVFIEPTRIRREYVLEEEFKLWRIYIQKGRKTTEYRKVEVPYGTYFKKNQMDITEEHYIHDTKDLPEGEVKRYKRDEYEAKEKERIRKEIMEHFQIRSIPMDSVYMMNNQNLNNQDQINTDQNNTDQNNQDQPR